MNISHDQLHRLYCLGQAIVNELERIKGWSFNPDDCSYLVIHKAALTEEIVQQLEESTGYRWNGERFIKTQEK